MCCVSSYHHLARKFQQIWTFTEQKPEKRPVGYEDISLVIPLYPTGVLVQGLLGDCFAFTTREPPFTETGKTVHLDILFVGDFKSVYDVNHHFGVYILKTFCQRRFANLRHKRFNRTCPTTSLHFNVVQPNGICQDSSFKLLTLPTTNTAPWQWAFPKQNVCLPIAIFSRVLAVRFRRPEGLKSENLSLKHSGFARETRNQSMLIRCNSGWLCHRIILVLVIGGR